MTPSRVDIFTLFPPMFAGPFDHSIVRRARDAGKVDIQVHDLRDWTHDRHRTADDTPYGGGAGMVMIAPPIVTGVEETLGPDLGSTPVLITSAAGEPFTQRLAEDLASLPRYAIVCGHYEGIDARVTDALGAREVSIGDYVLTGGELAAMVIVDAVTRLLPGVILAASIEEESHAAGLVEYPQYTRPLDFRGMIVPDVLLSGHHARIAAWRREQSIRRTALRRPDLLPIADLTPAERAMAESIDPDADQTPDPDRSPD
jgi:tRNA (guanine37-N1)-methyltransferase